MARIAASWGSKRRFRYPGRKRLPDRQALQEILFVLHTDRIGSWPLPLGCRANFAWLHQFKRLLARLDRRGEIREAFLALGCCLVCYRRLRNTSL